MGTSMMERLVVISHRSRYQRSYLTHVPPTYLVHLPCRNFTVRMAFATPIDFIEIPGYRANIMAHHTFIYIEIFGLVYQGQVFHALLTTEPPQTHGSRDGNAFGSSSNARSVIS